MDSAKKMNSIPPKTTQAVILAAGRGSRMHALTEHVPKCLVALASRPILAWTLDALRANGITDILVIGGWKHEALHAWCDTVRFNPDWSRSNMVRSLILASDWLQRAPTLIVYGDGAYSPTCIRQALQGPHHDWRLPIDRHWLDLWQRRFANPLIDAESLLLDGDRLLSIGHRPESLTQIHAQFMGLVHLQPAAWSRASRWLQQKETQDGAPSVDRMDTTGLLQGLLASGEHMRCINVDGGWVEIDSPSDIYCVEQALQLPGFPHDFRV